MAADARDIRDTRDAIVGNPVHRLWAIYALLSGLATFFPDRGRGPWAELLIIHVFLIALLWPIPPFREGWDALGRRWPRALRIPFDWLPLLVIPLLYTELATLNVMVHAGEYFDHVILAVERSIFGMPSRNLAVRFPVLPLSELLHAGYLSYYFIIFLPPLALYFMGRREDYRRALFTLLLSFFLHYLFFIYFPVQGPRYLFPAPGGEIARGTLYQLTHRLLEAGSSQGAAFPSSHVGVSVTQSLMMIRYLPKAAPFMLVATALLATGAVYGGFHYATDAFAGLVLGTIAVFLAPRVFELLGGRWQTQAQ